MSSINSHIWEIIKNQSKSRAKEEATLREAVQQHTEQMCSQMNECESRLIDCEVRLGQEQDCVKKLKLHISELERKLEEMLSAQADRDATMAQEIQGDLYSASDAASTRPISVARASTQVGCEEIQRKLCQGQSELWSVSQADSTRPISVTPAAPECTGVDIPCETPKSQLGNVPYDTPTEPIPKHTRQKVNIVLYSLSCVPQNSRVYLSTRSSLCIVDKYYSGTCV